MGGKGCHLTLRKIGLPVKKKEKRPETVVRLSARDLDISREGGKRI